MLKPALFGPRIKRREISGLVNFFNLCIVGQLISSNIIGSVISVFPYNLSMYSIFSIFRLLIWQNTPTRSIGNECPRSAAIAKRKINKFFRRNTATPWGAISDRS